MIRVQIQRLFPRFLLMDKNGFAMAKAMEKGLDIFCARIQEGIDGVICIDKMPEWRLDEMAWELGCLYDSSADVENKRAWIRDAIPLYASYGTIEAIYKYLGGYFDSVEVEEGWKYAGEPYHFRVTAEGNLDPSREAWAKKAIEKTKNVRSVLDDFAIGGSARICAMGRTEWWRFPYHGAEEQCRAGTHPQENFVGAMAEQDFTIQGAAAGHRYPYRQAGTYPQENTIGGTAEGNASVAGQGDGFRYAYIPAAQDQRTGTQPQENTGFADGSTGTAAQAEGEATVFSYPQAGETACGQDHF